MDVRNQSKAERNAKMYRCKNGLPVFRNKQVKAREHLLTGAYMDVRNQSKAERNAEMRRL